MVLVDFTSGDFVWDIEKEFANIRKHGIDFVTAARVFKDPRRKVFADSKHSEVEPRLFCIGRVDEKIVTVRFVTARPEYSVLGTGERGCYYGQED